MNLLKTKSQIFIIVTAIIVVMIYLVYSFIAMPRPRGLRIYPPGKQAATDSANEIHSTANYQYLSRIDPVAFCKSFGVDFNFIAESEKIIEKEPEKIEKPEKKPEPETEKKVASVDLTAFGYRLKGIIFSENKDSTIFLYDPDKKKTILLSEKSDSSIKIIEVSTRTVRLKTPEGTGILELETGKSGQTGLRSFGSAASKEAIQEKAARDFKAKRTLSSHETSESGIVEMINSKYLQVKPNRGNYDVIVNRVPKALNGYGLRPGDRIIGTSQKNFHRSQDVPLALGQVGKKPLPLKIRRGRQVIFLNPPAQKHKSDAKKKSP